MPPAGLGMPSSALCSSAYPDFDAYDNFVYSSMLGPKRRQHKTSVPQISPNFRPSKPRRQLSGEEASDQQPGTTTTTMTSGGGVTSSVNRSASFVVTSPTKDIDKESIMLSFRFLIVLLIFFLGTSIFVTFTVTFSKPSIKKKLSGSFPIEITGGSGQRATPTTSPMSGDEPIQRPMLGTLTVACGGTNRAIPPGSTAPTRGFYSPSFTSTGELGGLVAVGSAVAGAQGSMRVGSAEGWFQIGVSTKKCSYQCESGKIGLKRKSGMNLLKTGRLFAKLATGGMLEPEEVRRPLINPFKPSEFSVRITANRRRWIHVFPVDSRGLSKQSHHFVAGTSVIYANLQEPDPTEVLNLFSVFLSQLIIKRFRFPKHL